MAKPSQPFNKPKVYLAGKIEKTDFRHRLIPELRGHEWKDGPLAAEHLLYVGPFFVASDHSGYHGQNSHGALTYPFTFRQDYDQHDIIRNNNAGLEQADLVFAYITSVDCYGTLIEIGSALRAGQQVVIAFAPGIPHLDFWYGALQAARVHYEVRECCLPRLIVEALEALK